ncbi:MAG: tetraacyldisaccharide 4'-kinase [Vicingaceae bacterium]|nr:tetraacyldisaccharide 4'-kinase [Vicingaceae bacterium]
MRNFLILFWNLLCLRKLFSNFIHLYKIPNLLKRLVKILFLPISWLYALVMMVRNKFYDLKIFRSTNFKDVITINVGNLNIGGVGKTPHVAYLVQLLQSNYNIAILSRGYKRLTKGFVLATKTSSFEDIGDEPLQYKKKFNNCLIAVDEKRVRGIQQIKKLHPSTKVILLDDAFQHRAVNPDINILVTDYTNLFIYDNVLPSGRLREPIYGYKRADIIIVSKCPIVLSPIDRRRIIEEINPKDYQDIYFSYVSYNKLKPFNGTTENYLNLIDDKNASVMLLTGIANSFPLYCHLKSKYKVVEHMKFPDHHAFTENDMETLKTKFNNLIGNNKLIITTEKDLMRLSLPKISSLINDLPVFYIPIEVNFHGEDKKKFDEQITNYVRKNTTN